MVHYRRNLVAGGTYFFTAALWDRGADLLTRYFAELREALRATAVSRPFTTDAMVVLPDHLHAIWTLPAGDHDYSGRWRALKSRFVRGLRARGLSIRRNTRGEAQVWQRRFWEHTIADDLDYARHVDYIHFNPVKHGFVDRPADWSYSSFHRFVARGDLSVDWAGPPGGAELAGSGEPR